MKKILSSVLIVLVSLVIGYGTGYAIGHFITPDDSVSNESIGICRILLMFCLELAIFFGSFFVNTFLHEAEHLVGGLLTGYQFLSFRVGSLTLQKDNAGWHWKRYNINQPNGKLRLKDGIYFSVNTQWLYDGLQGIIKLAKAKGLKVTTQTDIPMPGLLSKRL